MSLVGFLLLLVIGAICGAIAGAIVGFRPGGFFLSAVTGFLGAVVGTWLARLIGLPSVLAVKVEGYTLEVLWAVIGAMLLLLVVGFFRRSAYRRTLV